MELISKLATALRGAGREVMEGVVDANGLRILEQEIYEFEQSLTGARRDLTRLVAERMRIEREIEAIDHSVRDGEAAVADALAADDGERAEALALWVAEKEEQRETLRLTSARLQRQEGALTRRLRESIHQLQGYQRELRLARAQQHVLRSGEQLAPAPSDEAVEASLARIRRRQRRREELAEARQQVDESLQSDLEQYRRTQSEQARARAAEAVLARVRLQSAPVRPQP